MGNIFCPGEATRTEAPEPARKIPKNDINYSSKDSLVEVVKRKAIQFIKPEYFIHLHENNLRMPKCQDVPREWVLDLDDPNLDWKNLEIIAISYCWIHHDHPDPDGYHLASLYGLFKLFIAGSIDAAQGRYTLKEGESPSSKSFLKTSNWCLGSGDGRPVGVFFDWMSVPQDKPKGSRTPEDFEVFKEALSNINLWYAHGNTITWRLSCLPEGLERTGYDDSGWTYFEWNVAGFIADQSHLILIDEKSRAELL